MRWRRVAGWTDDRLDLSGPGRKYLRKVFPDHWSFLLGEIALWSFVVLMITGVCLTLFFNRGWRRCCTRAVTCR